MKRHHFLIFLLVAFLLVAAIVALKTASGGLYSGNPDASDSLRQAPIASPDTTLASDVPQVESETFVSPADSISVDTRPADDAGYEDGYLQGMDDGALGLEKRAGYDESSAFPSARQRQQYAEAYREGYEKGFADGKNGRQFSIE